MLFVKAEARGEGEAVRIRRHGKSPVHENAAERTANAA
jgi:hypothetical protein